jgi:hypothetical protein
MSILTFRVLIGRESAEAGREEKRAWAFCPEGKLHLSSERC